MARPTTLCVLVLLVVLPGSETVAQSVPDPVVGSRVRLMAAAVSPKPLVGSIVRVDATTLELQMAGQKQTTLVPRDAITRAEISLGRSKERHVRIGALVGGAVGAIAELAWEGLGHLGTSEVGEVLEGLVRRMERHLSPERPAPDL